MTSRAKHPRINNNSKAEPEEISESEDDSQQEITQHTERVQTRLGHSSSKATSIGAWYRTHALQ